MKDDTLTFMGTPTTMSDTIHSDSSFVMARQLDYSRDSILFNGSGFWFEDVFTILKQQDSFGIQRHQAIQKPDRFATESLMLGLLLFEVFLVGFLLKRGLKLMIQYTRTGFGSSETAKIYSSNTTQIHFSSFLWILTLIVFSLMGHVVIRSSHGFDGYPLEAPIIFNVFIYTFTFFILQDLIGRTVARVFFPMERANGWSSNNKSMLFIYAMTLSPILIIAEIGALTQFNFIFIWMVIFLIITKVWMFVKVTRIFSVKRGGYLYFLLYLCALEILPILLYYKGLFLL